MALIPLELLPEEVSSPSLPKFVSDMANSYIDELGFTLEMGTVLEHIHLDSLYTYLPFNYI